MQKVRVEDAVGKILCHDITQVVPGEYKGARFKKGHIIGAQDVPLLLNLGKEHIFIWEQKQGMLHENAAAVRLAKCIAGAGIKFSDPGEGRVNLITAYDGLLKVNKDILFNINNIGEIAVASLHNNRAVREGTMVAGAKIIPLLIDEKKILSAENLCKQHGPVAEVVPFKNLRVGIVITGSEVYKGRIKDGFSPVIEGKIFSFGGSVAEVVFAPDDDRVITNHIQSMKDKGWDLVIVTGGMSVDPDDVTPKAIRMSGARQVAYGVPILPGAMFMLAYFDNVPVVGLPACAMFSKTTVFDLVLPRIFAGETINHKDLLELSYGGLCLSCQTCHYPDCNFGKY